MYFSFLDHLAFFSCMQAFIAYHGDSEILILLSRCSFCFLIVDWVSCFLIDAVDEHCCLANFYSDLYHFHRFICCISERLGCFMNQSSSNKFLLITLPMYISLANSSIIEIPCKHRSAEVFYSTRLDNFRWESRSQNNE